MQFETVREATWAWISEMNAFPADMIEELMGVHPGDWREITPASVCSRVYCYDYNAYGEVVASLADGYRVELEDGRIVEVDDGSLELKDCGLPMWGTLWQFNDYSDEWWLEENGGLQKMADCGFRVYEHREYGYFFGIDGAGYDFYSAHWIPLYRARELKWHKDLVKEALRRRMQN